MEIANTEYYFFKELKSKLEQLEEPMVRATVDSYTNLFEKTYLIETTIKFPIIDKRYGGIQVWVLWSAKELADFGQEKLRHIDFGKVSIEDKLSEVDGAIESARRALVKKTGKEMSFSDEGNLILMEVVQVKVDGTYMVQILDGEKVISYDIIVQGNKAEIIKID